MFFSSPFLLVSRTNLWVLLSIAASARSCLDKPVFTPPSLAVRYGQRASANCSVCQRDCLNNLSNTLEYAVGSKKEYGTDIFWEVDSLTEWDMRLFCSYNNANGLCFAVLHITLYQPPNKVSVRFAHGVDVLLAGQSYTLECAVQEVAPVKSLKVTFYRGREPLADRFSTREDKKPVNEVFTFSFNATEEDDGAEYWCDTQLGLKVEPVPPAVSSQRLPTTVHYKPRLISQRSPATISITEKQRLELNCLAEGKPSPSYAWTRPNAVGFLSSASVYSVESVSFDDSGMYTCTVSNSMGTVAVNFNVQVNDDHMEVLIGAVTVVLLLIIVGCIAYKKHYNRIHTGRYDLIKNISCCRDHTAVPTSA